MLERFRVDSAKISYRYLLINVSELLAPYKANVHLTPALTMLGKLLWFLKFQTILRLIY